MWSPIIFALIATGAGLLLARHVRERRFLAGNVLSSALVLAAMGAVLASGTQSLQAGLAPQHAVESDGSLFAALKARADSVAIQISVLRHGFIREHTNVSPAKDAGSNIDTHVRFSSAADVVRYLPRAAMIGFLAPFPEQWFAEGRKAGLAGRLISGMEMSVMYLIEVLVLIELWRSRSRLPVWLLSGIAAAGVTALALAVLNVGALYRMRYAFFILLLIVGANGLVRMFALRKTQSAPATAHLGGKAAHAGIHSGAGEATAVARQRPAL
jgi:hypothetical protein